MFCAMFQLENAMEPLRIWYVYAFWQRKQVLSETSIL